MDAPPTEPEIGEPLLSEGDEEVPLARFMWRSNDKQRVNWDLFVMIIATWNCFSLPFDVAFEPPIMSSVGFTITNFIIDFCFLLDIIVMFRTTFFDEKTGDECIDLKEIKRHYLRGRFWLDLIATIPVDNVAWLLTGGQADVSTLQLFGILKLTRVLRLSKLIAFMNVREDIKVNLKLAKLVFFLIMYLHVLGCAWWYIVRGDKNWLPPTDYVFV